MLFAIKAANILWNQGPNNGQLVLRILGSGFPQSKELKTEGGAGRIVPNEAVQVLIDGGVDANGAKSTIQGYDSNVRILSENILEVRSIRLSCLQFAGETRARERYWELLACLFT